MGQVNLAEHTGLLVRDACWVHASGILWRKQHPALSEQDVETENTALSEQDEEIEKCFLNKTRKQKTMHSEQDQETQQNLSAAAKVDKQVVLNAQTQCLYQGMYLLNRAVSRFFNAQSSMVVTLGHLYIFSQQSCGLKEQKMKGKGTARGTDQIFLKLNVCKSLRMNKKNIV